MSEQQEKFAGALIEAFLELAAENDGPYVNAARGVHYIAVDGHIDFWKLADVLLPKLKAIISEEQPS